VAVRGHGAELAGIVLDRELGGRPSPARKAQGGRGGGGGPRRRAAGRAPRRVHEGIR